MRKVWLAAAGVLLLTGTVAVLVWPSSDRPTRKPLSTLGHLLPAPAPGRPGPEVIPIPDGPLLAPAASQATPTHPVDGIRCQRNVPLLFHLHVHLTVFVNGEQRRLPAGIGIWPKLERQSGKFGEFKLTQGECLSWIITRYEDGLLHVEAPIVRTFVLGDLFTVWGQPLSRDTVGPAEGPVTAIVDGTVWTGDPRDIPLHRHGQIQLEVGTPLVAPQTVEFPGAF